MQNITRFLTFPPLFTELDGMCFVCFIVDAPEAKEFSDQFDNYHLC